MELRHGSRRREGHAVFRQRITHEVLSRVTILDFSFAEAVVAGDIPAHLARRGELIGRCAHWRNRPGPGAYGRDGECAPFRAYTSSPGRKPVGLETPTPPEKCLGSLLAGVSGLCRGAVCKTMGATTGGDHEPSPHALYEGNAGPGPGNSTARTCRARRVRRRGQAAARLRAYHARHHWQRPLREGRPTSPYGGELYGGVRSQPQGMGA
jgi:hypothetical protein